MCVYGIYVWCVSMCGICVVGVCVCVHVCIWCMRARARVCMAVHDSGQGTEAESLRLGHLPGRSHGLQLWLRRGGALLLEASWVAAYCSLSSCSMWWLIPGYWAGAPSPSHSFHLHSLVPTLVQSGDAATSEGGPWSRGGSVPGADSGLEELVEDSEEPCATQGEPGLRALGAEAGEEGWLGGKGSGKAQLRAGGSQTGLGSWWGAGGTEEGSFLTLLSSRDW